MTQTSNDSEPNIAAHPVTTVPISSTKTTGNIPPPPKTGFVGRCKELEQITTALQNKTRCITISGVEGQGKTCLAIEAARRLLDNVEVLQKAVFIDYNALVGMDAVDLAVKTLATVLEKDIKDVAVDILTAVPTLIIFDNVGTIPTESRGEFFELVKQWAETGECRVLLTGQTTDFNNFSYDDKDLQFLPLAGLTEEDALEYFQRRFKLSPPAQTTSPQPFQLLQTFAQIAFNPLAISILTISLKIYPWVEIENNLVKSLAKTPNQPLLATLQLALESWQAEVRLSGWQYWLAKLFKRATSQKLDLNQQTLITLPRLGIFKGGVFEPDLLEITDFSKKQWQLLCSILENTGLIQFEFLPAFKVPYIKFHSALAPILLSQFTSEEERIKVLIDYQQRYAQLAAFLFYEEGRDTVRIHALARQDLPNLLHAVYGALDANEKWTIKFANQVKLFLDIFALKRDSAVLQRHIDQIKKVKG